MNVNAHLVAVGLPRLPLKSTDEAKVMKPLKTLGILALQNL